MKHEHWQGKVVVGVQDSPAGDAALTRGVAEALQRRTGLHLVRIWREVDLLFSMTRSEVARLSKSEKTNKLMLERAAWRAAQLAPELTITTELLPGDLFEAMAGVSKAAQLLVVGSDRSNSDSDISEWIRERAQCPVIVVDAATAPA